MILLDFVHDGTDGPLIRLHRFEGVDAEALHRVCVDLAEGRLSEVRLHKQAWVRAVGGCRLIWRCATHNRGAWRMGAEGHVAVELDSEGWLEVADKALTLRDRSDGYQWLTNEGDVRVLLSRDGRW